MWAMELHLLDRELAALDRGLTIRVHGTHVYKEIMHMLTERAVASALKELLEI